MLSLLKSLPTHMDGILYHECHCNNTMQEKLNRSNSVLDIEKIKICNQCFRSETFIKDYKGQQLAEQTFQRVIIASAIVGFIYGYIVEQFGWTVYIVLAGFAISCLLTLPPWPMYRNHPLNWQPAVEPEEKKSSEGVKKPKKHK